MKRIVWNWLAASSLLLSLIANAETRPQYGGTLHLAMRTAPNTLDPADNAPPDSFARRSMTPLIFDTLVTLDENGRLQPSLAISWQESSNYQRWQFHVRRSVEFHDGRPLTPEAVAASLRTANPTWNITSTSDSVVIDRDAPDPEMLAELALPRNAIAKRNADGTLIGTGPFHITEWLPGKNLTLAAEENHWRGRPFVDGIEIEMGRSFRDQMTALDLGKIDLAEIAPEQSHRTATARVQIVTSPPIELVALVFTRDAASPEEKLLREALALSIERTSIRSVILQGAGQPAASILPNWMTGYAFVFPADADLPRARQICEQAREQIHSLPVWTIGYDNSDPLGRLLAERIALNAKDSGLSLQPTNSAAADLHVLRIPLTSADPELALNGVSTLIGVAPPKGRNDSVEDLYAIEQSILATHRLIPLFHLPVSYLSAPNLRDWTLRPDGTWNLENAWLENGSR
jgi:peptide/nickel transport system substrate-binding protein